MPFYSKRQWRWAFAQHKAWAHKAAHHTKGGPKARYRRLPAVSRRSGGRRRRRR